ncbi:MAG: oligosaccharide flippase family protein [Rikenellaceae bacterium]
MVNQVKAGAALSYVIIGINILVGVLYTPFMLRSLGQVEYGLYSLAASVIAYLTILDLGFGNAIVRYTAKFRAEGRLEEQQEMFGMFLRLYTLLGAIALTIGLALTLNIDALFGTSMSSGEMQSMRTMLILMSLNLAFTFPLSLFGSIISAYERFVFQKVVNIIRIIVNPLVMVLLLAMGYKAVALVVATTIFNLITLLINLYYCLAHLKIKVRFAPINFSFLHEVSIYSFWILLSVIMDRIYGSTGQFILGIYRDVEQVARYSISVQLKDMFYLFSTAITGVFLPRVTAMVSRGVAEGELSDIFIKTGRIQYIIIAAIFSGFVVLGRPFITLWAGADYSSAYLPTLLLFAASITPLIQNIGIIILQAQNRLKFRSLLYLAISLSSIALSIPLAIRYGGVGCAVATSASLLLGQGVIMNIYYARALKINIARFWGEIAKLSVVPTIAIVVGLSLDIQIDSIGKFMVAAICFMALYTPAIWLLGMNHEERGMILSPFRGSLKRV